MIFTVTLNPAVDKTVRLSGPIQVGEVNRIRSVERCAGGKGINVARALHVQDEPVVAYALLGGNAGRFITWILTKDGMDLRWVSTDVETRTNLKVVAPDGQVTEFNEPGNPVKSTCVRELLQMVESDALDEDTPPIILLCGSSPQDVENSVYNSLITKLQQNGCKVWVDCDGALLSVAMQARPDLIKPNLAEFSCLLGREITVENAVENATKCYEETGVSVLLTMGGDGSVYVGPEGITQMPAVPVAHPRTTVGAGDRFLANFAAAYVKGESPAAAMQKASAEVAHFLESQKPDERA